jgi:RNA polymerase sigma-70 factor (ECF subfamily)
MRLVYKSHKETSDLDLIILCQQRDRDAFEELINRNRRAIHALLYSMAPDWDTADLAQEVFIRMWRHIGNLRNPKAFHSWVRRITTHIFYDELRKQPRTLATVSMDGPISADDDATTRDIEDKSAGPELLLQRQEMAEVIQGAMSKLPTQFRTAIQLRELDGLSYEEIAAVTHAELGTVKSRIARARNRVQALVRPYLKGA